MAELLLEILSEEIPARMQARAADDLKRLMCDGIKDAGLEFSSAETYVTPRRLVFVAEGIPERTPDISRAQGPRHQRAGKSHRRLPRQRRPDH